MEQIFKEAFAKYPASLAPFMHQQFHHWQQTKPLQNIRIAHHIPVVQNTLLKIACLVAAGAEVTVSNPDFMNPCPHTLDILKQEKIKFVPDLLALVGEEFDIYLDCGAVLYNTLGAPKIGAVELTGTGDQLYRQLSPTCPVISIDRSLTKQLETVFGTAVSAMVAMTKLTNKTLDNTSWVVFGFGKIGRGIAYLCKQKGYDITIVDTHPNARAHAAKLGINTIASDDINAVHQALNKADIIITSTGVSDALSAYQKSWFQGKVLANMGILDEFGSRFATHEILYNKKPINFSLNDPTPITYIDPELYAHNQVALHLLKGDLANGVHSMKSEFDNDTINQWCRYHSETRDEIERWFARF